MLKRVLALPGQTVCRKGLTISVDAIDMGEALSRDSRGRPLPVWQGCRVVDADELFLMNWQSADSLDGPLVVGASVLGGSAVLLIQALPPILHGFP
jgi:type IV secretory pathway protease TraF